MKTYTLDSVISTYALAEMFQTNPSSIRKWSLDGRLPCYTTPGGHRRFRVRDALEFAWRYNFPVPVELRDARRALDDEIIAKNAKFFCSCANRANKNCTGCGK